MSCLPHPEARRESGVAGLRMRRGMFGKAILQVRYHMESCKLRPPGSEPAEWKPCGMSDWRDVDADNLSEVSLASKAMESC